MVKNNFKQKLYFIIQKYIELSKDNIKLKRKINIFFFIKNNVKVYKINLKKIIYFIKKKLFIYLIN